MRHATTNYRAIMARIDTGDSSVQCANYLDFFGDMRYWVYRNGDRFEVSLNHKARTARPIRVVLDGYEMEIYKSAWLYNPKRVNEADDLLHEWLYPKPNKHPERIPGFKSLLPYM